MSTKTKSGSVVIGSEVFDDLTLDHVRCYVDNLDEALRQFGPAYGLHGFGVRAEPSPVERSAILAAGRVRLLFTEPLVDDHPGRSYLAAHGFGVADIALATSDVAAVYAAAVAAGARSISPPVERDGVVSACITGFADVVHTLVQRHDGPIGADPAGYVGLPPASEAVPHANVDLLAIDHFAICLEPGELAASVRFYRDVLGFSSIFSEHVFVGEQAMNSEVVQSASADVTLTLFEPDTSRNPGQIDDFLKNHGGPGVQHVAFSCADIVKTASVMSEWGVEFLDTPDAYYRQLRERLQLRGHSVTELQRFGLLVDEDHDGQLFQVFTRSVHPRRTFFTELIERAGASTFGSGNIKALYEAVEAEGRP